MVPGWLSLTGLSWLRIDLSFGTFGYLPPSSSLLMSLSWISFLEGSNLNDPVFFLNIDQNTLFHLNWKWLKTSMGPETSFVLTTQILFGQNHWHSVPKNLVSRANITVYWVITEAQATQTNYFSTGNNKSVVHAVPFKSKLTKKMILDRQVQKSDQINSDHQSGSDQLGSTRIK